MPPNIPFSSDEDERVAYSILDLQHRRVQFARSIGLLRDNGEGSKPSMKGSVTEDADYEDIEDELDEASQFLSTPHEKSQPRVAEKIELHMKHVGFHLRYMAEGGANVVFKIELNGVERFAILPSLTRKKMEALQGMLLRVRKGWCLPLQRTTCQIMKEYEQRIKPLFPPKCLLRQKLIRLPRHITVLLEKMLVDAEQQGVRPPMRRGQRLVPQSYQEDGFSPGPWTEDHGLLIQDMSPRAYTEHLLEFKPKWLTSCRRATATAKRCRTCALREMRRADGATPGRGDSGFCPLDLLSNKSYVLRPALRKLWTVNNFEDEDPPDIDLGAWPDVASLVVGDSAQDFANVGKSRFEMFETEFRRKVQPVLGRLKSLQGMHCHVSVQDFNSSGADDVSLAMALRDCSVFVRIEANREKIEILDVKLADLDLKATTRSKRNKWMGMELRLVEEGWYGGKLAPSIVEDEITCWVSRSCT